MKAIFAEQLKNGELKFNINSDTTVTYPGKNMLDCSASI